MDMEMLKDKVLKLFEETDRQAWNDGYEKGRKDASITRQSTTSKEVESAIEWTEKALSNSKIWQDGDFGIPFKTSLKLENIKQTILVAL